MPWWGWVLIGIGGFVVLASYSTTVQQKGKAKKGKGRRGKGDETPEQVAAAVETPVQFRALWRRMERAEEAMHNASSEAAYDRAAARHDLLQEAISIVERKTLAWQYIPSLGLDTPLSVLENAYRVFPASEYEAARAQLGGDEHDWYGLDAGGEDVEKPESYFNGLKKFREIVESDMPREEKAAEITKQCGRYRALKGEFFETGKGAMKLGDQWLVGELHDDGMPKAEEMFLQGYRSPEDCLKIDPTEFAKRKGVGPKTVAKLEAYQDKVRARMSGPSQPPSHLPSTQ